MLANPAFQPALRYDVMVRYWTTLIWLLMALATASANAFEDAVEFEVDVRSILKAHCWQCHGEEKELHGGMDARLVRFLLKGGESGAAIVPGDHAASLLYQRMASGEMPPGKKKVSPEELERIANGLMLAQRQRALNQRHSPSADTIHG